MSELSGAPEGEGAEPARDPIGRDDDVSNGDRQALVALFAALVENAEPSNLAPLEVVRLAAREWRAATAQRARRFRISRSVLIAALLVAVAVWAVPRLGTPSSDTAASSVSNASTAAAAAPAASAAGSAAAAGSASAAAASPAAASPAATSQAAAAGPASSGQPNAAPSSAGAMASGAMASGAMSSASASSAAMSSAAAPTGPVAGALSSAAASESRKEVSAGAPTSAGAPASSVATLGSAASGHACPTLTTAAAKAVVEALPPDYRGAAIDVRECTLRVIPGQGRPTVELQVGRSAPGACARSPHPSCTPTIESYAFAGPGATFPQLNVYGNGLVVILDAGAGRPGRGELVAAAKALITALS
jgi:hypothetical protein